MSNVYIYIYIICIYVSYIIYANSHLFSPVHVCFEDVCIFSAVSATPSSNATQNSSESRGKADRMKRPQALAEPRNIAKKQLPSGNLT